MLFYRLFLALFGVNVSNVEGCRKDEQGGLSVYAREKVCYEAATH